MKSYFFCNVKNVEQLTEQYNNAVENDITRIKYNIIARINLSDTEYFVFCNNIMSNHLWLNKYIEIMNIDKDYTWNCVLVLNDNCDFGVLCFNMGNSYPKYVGLYDKY